MIKVTQAMENVFIGRAFASHEQVTASVAAGLEAVFAMPEMEALERFARAAAALAVTDGVDEWNGMVDVWDTLPQEVANSLLEPR